MKMSRLINKYKIKRILDYRSNIRDTYKKLYWLEFENESILKFLAKYNILGSKRVSADRIPAEIKTSNFVDITVEEEYPFIT
jgi:hypothetical protein